MTSRSEGKAYGGERPAPEYSDLSSTESEDSGSQSASGAGKSKDNWRTVLYVALTRGDRQTVRRVLLSHGNPVNDPLFTTGSPQSGIAVRKAATALHVAAWAGQSSMCKWLLRHGADASARDGLHMTPAEVATSAEVVHILSRSHKYRRRFRKAVAGLTMEQRVEGLEEAVRRLQFGVDSTSTLGLNERKGRMVARAPPPPPPPP